MHIPPMSADLKIRRIAIAVRNLAKARKLYETVFGGPFLPPPGGTSEGVSCLEWDRGEDQPILELVQALNPESAIARFIRKQGEGIHHISVEVPDLEETLARLEAAGGRVVRTPSHYRNADGSPLKEAFLHPKDTHGLLFHVAEAR